MVADRERAERFRRLREDMVALSKGDPDGYLDETAAWDSALSDGLDEPANG